MSASSKKKLRKEQTAALQTEKQKAAKKEATKLKIYTWSFWVVLALCVALVAGIALKAPINDLTNQLTTALEVGEHKLSAVELNYFYIDAINEYCNENSSWINYLIDTSSPIGKQVVDKETGETWADSFLNTAIDNAKNTYALYDDAVAAGHKLSDEEQSSVKSLYDNMDVYASYYGYNSASAYLKSVYGYGANEDTYKKYYEVTVLAASYYSAHAKELKDSYKDVDIRGYEEDKLYEYNSYSYASHYMSVDKFKTGGTKDDAGNMTYTEEEIKAAEAAVKEAAEKLAVKENNTVELLNEAIKALEKAMAEAEKEDTKDEAKDEDKKDETTETTPDAQTEDDNSADATEPSKSEDKDDKKDDEKEEETKYSTASESTDTLYSSISSIMQEWIRDTERKEGDITAIPYTSKSTDADGKEVETLKGYYVVLDKGSKDNTTALANVRHILVAFEGGTTNSTTGQTTYSQAEKNKAKEAAYELYDEWLYDGDGATEEHFIEMAKKHTDDSNGEDGGLYEDVYPGQMVTTFNDWCFDETRKPGDHGVVETTYGYHIMYYVGASETTYRDYMIVNDMLTEDMEEWQKGLNDAMTLTEKNTSRIDRDLILKSGS